MIQPSNLITAHHTCRACAQDGTKTILRPVLSLGSVPISTFVTADNEDAPAQCPLELTICPACRTVQLRHTVDPHALYDQFWYRSGINETMRHELQHVALEAITRVPVDSGSRVLDIGANDGTLLEAYRMLSPGAVPVRVGIEPARNLLHLLEAHCEVAVVSLFPPRTPHFAVDTYAPYHIITSIAMFYDLDDPNAFVHAVKERLAPNGVWVIQLQDLEQMLRQGAWDNICHEHLQYYTLASLRKVLATNALEVYDVEPRAINGGSLRVYVGHREQPPSWATEAAKNRVLGQIEREDAAGLLQTESIVLAFERLNRRINATREQLHGIIGSMGGLDGYGASTKGNTLFPVCGLNSHHIRQIADRNPEKIGRETVGSRIPIVSEETWRANPAKATLVPIWQFRDHVIARERDYLQQGGALIFPLPEVDIVQG